MEKLDDRELDLIKGKYDRPPGVKDYEPPEVPMPKPTPPTGLMKISPVFTDTGSVSQTHATVSTASSDYCSRLPDIWKAGIVDDRQIIFR